MMDVGRCSCLAALLSGSDALKVPGSPLLRGRCPWVAVLGIASQTPDPHGPRRDAEAAGQLMQLWATAACPALLIPGRVAPGPRLPWWQPRRVRARPSHVPPALGAAGACGDLPSCGRCSVSPSVRLPLPWPISPLPPFRLCSGRPWLCSREGWVLWERKPVGPCRHSTGQPTWGSHLPAPCTLCQGMRATVHLLEPGCHLRHHS